MSDAVRDNTAAQRYEMDVMGGIAYITYRRSPGVLTLLHAEVPRELYAQGLGSELTRAVLQLARAQGCKVVPRCPFIAHYMKKHAEFQDLLDAAR